MTVTINVIGGVQVLVDGRPVKLRRQVQRVAAILVAAGPAGIEASALAEELWLGNPPARWNPAVRNAVTSLRSEVGSDVVATAGGRYSLQCEVENVDAWVFLEAAASQTPANNGIGGVNGIGRFQPFSGLELTPLLSEMTEALHNARLHMIERVTEPGHLDPALVTGLVSSVRADPFAETLSVAVVGMLTRVGQIPDAIQLLDDIDSAYRTELNTEPPPSILRARQLAESGGHVAVGRQRSVPRSLPSIIGDLIERPMTPRHQGLAREAAEQIASRKQSRRWSILGLAGSGKSRFVAEVGSQLHETGTDIIFATAVGDESSAYSPFLTASPTFRRRFLDLATPSEPSVWALWSSVVEELGSQGRPIALIVDDAHQLDRLSIRMLQFMHRMELAVPITTIIVGRSSTHEHDWRPFEHELLTDDRTEPIHIPALDLDDVDLLVKQRWPHVRDLVSRDAAREVVTASGGLPMVTHLLIDSLTGPTLRLPQRPRGHQVDMATDRLEAFDADTQAVLAAATLVGSPFSADDLAELIEREPDEIDALLDTAARAAVLSNMEEPDTYRFVHDLLAQAAVGLVPRSERARLGQRLMKQTEDPLRLARLALVADDLLPPEQTARLVTAGARAALDRNLTRASVQLAQLALDLATASDQEALACLAVGQVRLGALDEAAITRAALLDATSTPTEQALAIQALLDSLSLVETDNATAIKVSDFDRLDVTGLPRETQFQCAVQVARLAANENNERRRDDELERARALQKTGFETARLFFTEWTCASQHIDSQWFERLDEIRGSVGGDETIAVLSQIESYEYAARGQWLEAEQSNAGFLRAGTAISSPELQWQSKLASAGFAFGRGDLEESERLANDAFTHGMVFALPLAPAARAAHAFCQALHTGSVDKWLDFVENVSPDLLRNTLAMAAVGRARYEVGRVDEAWQIAEPILPTVFKRERRMATSVVAVLAPLMRKRAAPGLRQQCVDLLRRAGDQWTITGAGIAIHGPASRSLAILEGDRRTLHRLRHELADTPLWVAALDDDIARIDREH